VLGDPDFRGRWLPASQITELVQARYPTVATLVNNKIVAEYLKTMMLKRKKILTTLYCFDIQISR
jgi:hypothetical protein